MIIDYTVLDPFVQKVKMGKNTVKLSKAEFIGKVDLLLAKNIISTHESENIFGMLQSPDRDNHFMSYKIIQERLSQLEGKKRFVLTEISDRLQVFEDVLSVTSRKLNEITPYSDPKNKSQISTNAGEKIKLVVEAYNEGAILDFSDANQTKYFPYFEKKGGVWCFSSCNSWDSYADVGSGFHYDSSEHCEDGARKFIDIYREWLPE